MTIENFDREGGGRNCHCQASCQKILRNDKFFEFFLIEYKKIKQGKYRIVYRDVFYCILVDR